MKVGVLAVAALLLAPAARADEPPMQMPSAPSQPAPMHFHVMHMTGPLGLTHSREASGTSWQPDSTPVYAVHLMYDDWMVMAHYLVFGAFDDMEGARGKTALFSANWGMVMVQHPLLGGTMQGRAMLSLEPLTVPARGYPLLLQTGETYAGQALHDVQHPHDLFMELALTYQRELAGGVAAQVYAAPVGEPALGPTGFPHRESAALDPLAPITHHHLDSTHVSFGVVTAALYTRMFKLEGSAFNGHEPDEHRWGFDPIALNSWSARLQWAACRGFVAQASYGHLSSPEALRPGEDQDRFTVSGTADWRLEEGNWATTAAYALKREAGVSSSAVLLESNLNADGNNNVFGRFEWVQRTPEDLALDASYGEVLPVAEASLGYMYETDPIEGMRVGVGALGMLGFVPDALQDVYGGTAAPGFAIYLRLRPANRM